MPGEAKRFPFFEHQKEGERLEQSPSMQRLRRDAGARRPVLPGLRTARTGSACRADLLRKLRPSQPFRRPVLHCLRRAAERGRPRARPLGRAGRKAAIGLRQRPRSGRRAGGGPRRKAEAELREEPRTGQRFRNGLRREAGIQEEPPEWRGGFRRAGWSSVEQAPLRRRPEGEVPGRPRCGSL